MIHQNIHVLVSGYFGVRSTTFPAAFAERLMLKNTHIQIIIQKVDSGQVEEN